MKKILIIFMALICFTPIVFAEDTEYYNFNTPLKMKKTSFDYQPPSSLKLNEKEFIPTTETNTVKTHFSVNTDSMPKGIYRNNFVYTNGPLGGLRPTHVPSFDTQHVQYWRMYLLN